MRERGGVETLREGVVMGGKKLIKEREPRDEAGELGEGEKEYYQIV